MPYLQVRQNSADFARWKSVFDRSRSIRRAFGEKSCRVFRNADDPNNVVVLNEWDSVDNIRKFIVSPEMREGIEEAGVTGQPDIIIMEESDPGLT